MPRMKEVTYEKVAEVADRLTREYRRVSTRAVLAETGGSMSVVNGYLQEWRRRRSERGRGTFTFSEQLRAAVEEEIRHHSAALREDLRKQLQEAEARETENRELLKEAEGRIEDLSAELEKMKEEKERIVQEAEVKAALCEQRALSAEQKSREIEEALASVQLKLADADKRAAVAEGRSAALADHLKHLERENARLSSSLEAAQREKEKLVRKKSKELGK